MSEESSKRNAKLCRRYVAQSTIIGAFLGLGAPAGYLVLTHDFFNPENVSFVAWVVHAFEEQTWLMLYLTIPTVLVFSLFGYYHGMQERALAIRSEKMEHFLHVAAHDIGNPLTAIKEGVAQIRDGLLGPINEEQKEFTDLVYGQTDVMGELIRELLDIHKMEGGKYRLDSKPTELYGLLKRAAAEMGILMDQKQGQIEVKYQLPKNTLLLIDPFRMRQVLRNIIGNGHKYLPKGGKIKIHSRLDENDVVELDISNDGPQIPPETLSTIFDKFAQASRRDQSLGTGLGLSICKNVVELHGGKIWAENLDPTGVCFKIRLPSRCLLKGANESRLVGGNMQEA